jgi:hypothetical protein
MDVREKTLNEKRLIDADRRTIATALKMIHDADFTPGVYEHSVYGKAALLLEKDAVSVVRCRECKYHNKPPCPMRLSFNWTEDNDFCSYGERKEGADNG